MDYELASRELIRALRAGRSQRAVQRRLGRASNVLHAWETGTRYPTASEFLKLLQLSGRAPQALLSRFAPCQGTTLRALVSSWLNALVHDRAQAEIAYAVQVNRNTVARWLKGVSEPRLPQLLAFIEVSTQRVLDFVAAVVDPRLLTSVAAAYEDLTQQRALAYEMPWAHAVLRVLELEGYRTLAKHEPGFIAARVGISLADEERCLAALRQARQVYSRGGKLHARRVLSVDTRDDPGKNLGLKRHWFRVVSERLARDGIGIDGLASYNLFAISDADLERVRQAHLDYYERLRSIVAESTKPTRVVLVALALTPLDGRP